MSRTTNAIPEGATWGEFGPDDRVGRMNYIDPATRLAAFAEVRTGECFCLSLPLDVPRTPLAAFRPGPVLRPSQRDGQDFYGYHTSAQMPSARDVVNDDAALLHLQFSTQWDALCHIGHLYDLRGDGQAEATYYNGFTAGDGVGVRQPAATSATPGAQCTQSASSGGPLGIENLAETCVQGRGVMIDLAWHLPGEHGPVSFEQIARIIEADRIDIRPGDIVCFHTGQADRLLHEGSDQEVSLVLDGNDPELQQWIRNSKVAALVADNYAVEIPPGDGPAGESVLPLHHLCLVKLGVHLAELWHLTPLAQWLRANHRTSFLLTAPPLRLPGAVGSPVTPVATV